MSNRNLAERLGYDSTGALQTAKELKCAMAWLLSAVEFAIVVGALYAAAKFSKSDIVFWIAFVVNMAFCVYVYTSIFLGLASITVSDRVGRLIPKYLLEFLALIAAAISLVFTGMTNGILSAAISPT